MPIDGPRLPALMFIVPCFTDYSVLHIKQLNFADPLLISRSPGFATGLAQAQWPILVGSFDLPPPMKLEVLVCLYELMDRQLAFKRLSHPPSWSAQSDDTLVVFGSKLSRSMCGSGLDGTHLESSAMHPF